MQEKNLPQRRAHSSAVRQIVLTYFVHDLKYNWIEPPAKQAIVVKSLHDKTTGYKTCDPRRLSSGSRDSLNVLLIILSIINMSFCTSDSAHTLQLKLTFTCKKLSDMKEMETIALKLN